LVSSRYCDRTDKDPKGNVSVQIKAGSLPAAKEKRLLEFLEKLFD